MPNAPPLPLRIKIWPLKFGDDSLQLKIEDVSEHGKCFFWLQ